MAGIVVNYDDKVVADVLLFLGTLWVGFPRWHQRGNVEHHLHDVIMPRDGEAAVFSPFRIQAPAVYRSAFDVLQTDVRPETLQKLHVSPASERIRQHRRFRRFLVSIGVDHSDLVSFVRQGAVENFQRVVEFLGVRRNLNEVRQ